VRRLKVIPQNELGVIVKFAIEGREHGFEITDVRGSFPDATIVVDSCTYEAEFEFKSSSVFLHEHDLRKCDTIICWENDIGDIGIPILELSNPFWYSTDMASKDRDKQELAYWRHRAELAEKRFNTTMRAQNRVNAGEKYSYGIHPGLVDTHYDEILSIVKGDISYELFTSRDMQEVLEISSTKAYRVLAYGVMCGTLDYCGRSGKPAYKRYRFNIAEQESTYEDNDGIADSVDATNTNS
jgi:hypothetical protein